MTNSHATWPASDSYTEAGYARVETPISCVLTRFCLRSRWSLIPFYFAFRKVRNESRKIGGLLQAVLLVENLRTCYTLSLWKDDRSIVEFSTHVRSHIMAANWSIGRTFHPERARLEIWSAQFRLWAVSAHNLNWEGLDLQSHLGDQWVRREQVRDMVTHAAVEGATVAEESVQ